MEFYLVKDEEIQLSNKLTQNNIVFILDGKAGYIWKGTEAIDLDETTAKKVEALIQKTFVDIEFGLIPNTEIVASDDPKIIQIKTEIMSRLPKLKEKTPSIFNKIKNKIIEFKNYETSVDWRKKLSNLTNVWKLSILNIIVIALSVLLIFSQSLFHMSIGDYYPLFALIGLLLILIINFIFVIFPMNFPLNVVSIGEGPITTGQQFPPQPITPEVSGKKVAKGRGLKQLEIAPLSAPAKGKKVTKGKGAEYQTEEDLSLGIPTIPDAPPKKLKITVDSPGLSTGLIEKMKTMESKTAKVVLVNCERCKDVIPVPVPINAVKKSRIPVVPISYVHKNPKDKDQHCITIYLDHDFDIRRQRNSDVVIS